MEVLELLVQGSRHPEPSLTKSIFPLNLNLEH
jgi:hypothetical protein